MTLETLGWILVGACIAQILYILYRMIRGYGYEGKRHQGSERCISRKYGYRCSHITGETGHDLHHSDRARLYWSSVMSDQMQGITYKEKD